MKEELDIVSIRSSILHSALFQFGFSGSLTVARHFLMMRRLIIFPTILYVIPIYMGFEDHTNFLRRITETKTYHLVWAKKVLLAAICLVAGSASFGIQEN